jgi:steroid delta-isomerase-like uncharacterized protein
MEITSAHVHAWLDAWNSHNIDRIKGLFAEDMIMYQPQNPKPLSRDGAVGYFSMLFGTYPDIHFAGDGFLIQGNEVASWEVVTGTMTGPFHDPATGHEIPPTGKSFEIPGAMRLIYNEDGLIKSVRIYWDRQSFSQQLGLGAPTLPDDALVIRPNDETINVINLFKTTPDHVDQLADLVVSGVTSTASKNPGFVRGAVLKSIDGQTVANISQWTGGVAQLTANHQANENSESYRQQMEVIAKIGTQEPHGYTVIFTTKAS